MTNRVTFSHIVSQLSAQLIYRLADENRITYIDACVIFYKSDTYRALANEKTKCWTESEVYLYEALCKELRGMPAFG